MGGRREAYEGRDIHTQTHTYVADHAVVEQQPTQQCKAMNLRLNNNNEVAMVHRALRL